MSDARKELSSVTLLDNETYFFEDEIARQSTDEMVIDPSSIASFKAAVDLPLKSLKAKIEPVQDLKGYDHPWPAGGGKNKLSLASLTLGGTESRTKRIEIDAIPAGTYKFTTNNTGTETAFLRYGLQFFDAVTEGTNVGEATNGGTFTLSGEAKSIYIWMSSNSYSDGKTVILSDMMICLATETDATYEPYSNICPISGFTGAKVIRAGKNLCTPGSKYYGYWLNGSWHESRDWYGFIIPVEPGDDLYISGNQSQQGVNCVWLTSRSDPTKALSGYTDTGVSRINNVKVTAPQGAKAFWMAQNGSADISTLQVEYGSARTSYEAPVDNTYNITFPSEAGTVYGGTLDVTTGLLTVEYASYTIDENQNFTDRISNQGRVYFPVPNMKSDYIGLDDERCVCDRLRKQATSFESSQSLGITIGATNAYAYIGGPTSIPGVTDLASLKAWLASNNITFTYELATPITYQLTPQEVKALIGENNIWADTGDVEVVYGAYLAAIKDMIDMREVQVDGTVVHLNASENTRYICGEVATLDLTPPASGMCDIVFTSGNTPTVLTVPSTVKWMHGFDPNALAANTIYELNIMDGLGVVASWI